MNKIAKVPPPHMCSKYMYSCSSRHASQFLPISSVKKAFDEHLTRSWFETRLNFLHVLYGEEKPFLSIPPRWRAGAFLKKDRGISPWVFLNATVS